MEKKKTKKAKNQKKPKKPKTENQTHSDTVCAAQRSHYEGMETDVKGF